MSLFQNRMVSVRQILRKTRTRTIIAVIATSVLATVCIGGLVYQAISQIQFGTNEITVEAHGYELERETLIAWGSEIEKQTSEIRDYLLKLRTDVESSSAALDEIYTLYKENKLSAVSDVCTDMSILREKIEAALVQIDLINREISGEDGINETVKNRTDVLMSELNTMLSGINERYMLVQSEMDRLIVVLNQSGIMESGKMAATIETLHAFARQETDTLSDIRAQLDQHLGSLSDLGTQAQETRAAIDTLGVKIGENGNSSRAIAEQIQATQADIAALQTVIGQISSDQQIIVGMLNTTNQILAETGAMVNEGNARYADLAARLEEQKSNLEALSVNVEANGNSIQTIGTTLETQATQINEISGKIAFPLGIDSQGEYGYYKTGADSVTPFRHPGLPTGDRVSLNHSHVGNTQAGGPCFSGPPQTYTSTIQCNGSLGQGWYSYPVQYCTGCAKYDFNTAPVCPATGGGHNFVTKNMWHCNIHGNDFAEGNRCPYENVYTATSYPQTCYAATCANLYIENKNIRRAVESCALNVCTERGDSGLVILACAWSTAEGGVISGNANTQEIIAAHRGMYYCQVTYQDLVSGGVGYATVQYNVTNLAH